MTAMQPMTGPFVGEFVINPQADIFRDLAPACDAGHPYRCLIGTWGAMSLGVRLRAMLNHESPEDSYIGVTHSGYSWRRPMTAEERKFAQQFDVASAENNGRKLPRRPLTVRIDLSDGTWVAQPANSHESKTHTRTNARPSGTTRGNRQRAFVRSRQLDTLRKQYAAEHAQLVPDPAA